MIDERGRILAGVEQLLHVCPRSAERLTHRHALEGVAARVERAAEYVVIFWRSRGNGPTSVTPFTGRISLIWCTQRSA